MEMNHANIDKSIFTITNLIIDRFQGLIQAYSHFPQTLKQDLLSHKLRSLTQLNPKFSGKSFSSDRCKEFQIEQMCQLDTNMQIKQQNRFTKPKKYKRQQYAYCKLCRQKLKDDLSFVFHNYDKHGINFIVISPEESQNLLENQENEQQSEQSQKLNDKIIYEQRDNESQFLKILEDVQYYSQIEPTQHKKISKFKMIHKAFERGQKKKNILCNICQSSHSGYIALLRHQKDYHGLEVESLQINPQLKHIKKAKEVIQNEKSSIPNSQLNPNITEKQAIVETGISGIDNLSNEQ